MSRRVAGCARRNGWSFAVVAGMVVFAAAAPVQASVVPLELDCWVYAKASAGESPAVIDEGWNEAYAVVVDPHEGTSTAWIKCTNLDDGAATIEAETIPADSMYPGPAYTRIDSPAELTIGTTPTFPAGTPLTLLVTMSASPSSTIFASTRHFGLERVGDPLLYVDQAGSFSVDVFAGEVLTPSFVCQHYGEYGTGSMTVDLTVVPEPATLGLLTIVGVACVRRR